MADYNIAGALHRVATEQSDQIALVTGRDGIYQQWNFKEVEANSNRYPVDFLNSLSLSGLPQHQLVLKLGCPISLMRNLDPTVGHCNGSRYIVTALLDHIIEARCMMGKCAGQTILIPRIPLQPDAKRFPFEFQRRQFPVRLCFAMTANKAQGQTLEQAGIYLPKDFWSHGQLYVACSRVGNPQNLKIYSQTGHYPHQKGLHTRNEVFRAIFN